jgi:regulator of cell morphogenesis and NO signaling
MENLEQAVIGQLVAYNYRTAAIFRKHNIDFCCNGNRTLEEACQKKKIDIDAVKNELEDVLTVRESGDVDYNSWGLDALADHIVQKHHGYVTIQIPVLQAYLRKLGSVHGNEHPELHDIAMLFGACAAELTMHMKKEELMLFPYIKQMVASQRNGTTVDTAAFGSVNNPIAMMMREHDQEGERFRKIQELSNNFTVPPDGCNTYHVTYSLLKEFQDDLHLHIHLENNILFPKAAIMEENTREIGNSCSIQR